MKHLLTLLLYLSTFETINAQAPDWEWAKSGDGGSAEGWALTTDASENNYFCGWYFGNITFDAFTLTGVNPQTYLVKYDSSGNVLWAISTTAPSGANAYGMGVASDDSGNIYMTGILSGGTVYFGTHPLTSVGAWDVFLAKYDSSGNNIWVRSAAGSVSLMWNSISINHHGDIFITGNYYASSMVFGSDTLSNAGGDDFFIAKYDHAGNEIWARSAGGNGNDNSNAVIADPSGNSYLTGFFNSPSIIFGNDTLINAGGKDFFIVKYDSSGNVVWSRQVGGVDNDFGFCIALKSDGNLCVAGAYWSPSITFGSNTLTNSLGGDLFLTQYDSAGNVQWVKDYPATQGGSPYGIDLDSFDNIYLSGGMSYFPMHFDTVTLINPAPQNGDAMFIVKFDSTGNGIWGKTLVSGGDDENAITLAPSGNIYIGGDYINTIPFIVGTTILTMNVAAESPFIAKLNNDIFVAAGFSSTNQICPGTCSNFTNLSINAASYQWFFPGATPPTSAAVNPTNICYATPGTYDVQLIASNANGSDTLLLTNYITVYPSPPPQSISQSGDTLFAIQGSASYQWYFNTNIITGATDYFYVAPASGDYNVVATDANGCEVEAAVFNVVAGVLSTVNSEPLTIFPNPVEEKFTMHNSEFTMRTATNISIYNSMGGMVLAIPLPTANCNVQTFSINVESLSSGLYYLEIKTSEKTFRSKFVKK